MCHLGRAAAAVGGWSALARQLAREFARARRGRWRRAYGALIGYLAIGGRDLDGWYRRWVIRAESPPATGIESKLVLVASPGHLDESELGVLLRHLVACARYGMVFIDAEAPATETAVGALGQAGIAAIPTRGDFTLAALPDDCVGLVILGPHVCPNPSTIPELSRAVADGADLVYGDADEIGVDGRRRRPRFRAGFSLDLFFHDDFVSDCFAVPRTLLDAVGPWDFQDPQASLFRWLPSASDIRHLPRILSHSLRPPRRASEPNAYLETFLRQRYGERAGVERVPNGTATPWRCRFGSPPDARVSVVVPTRDRLDLLAPCVDSLYEKNDPARFEVLIVDNASTDPATRQWLADAPGQRSRLRVLGAHGAFNWSWLNNLAIEVGTGDVFVFLNNDTLSITEGWLARLAEYALRPDAGAVGPLLLYEDDSIQHAGLVVGDGDHADQLYRGVDVNFDDLAFVSPLLPRNVAAVTGACLATSRKTIEAVGSFDEGLPVSGDVEFCLRIHEQGLCNIYAPDVALYHFESRSRGVEPNREDLLRLAREINRRMPHDPFYNPNLACIAGIGRGGPGYALLHEDTSREHLAPTKNAG